jgi:hypothetical protein
MSEAADPVLARRHKAISRWRIRTEADEEDLRTQPSPNGVLVAARELLRNPPDLAASPDVLRQWHNNVDRLLNLAQVSPGSAGGSVSR